MKEKGTHLPHWQTGRVRGVCCIIKYKMLWSHRLWPIRPSLSMEYQAKIWSRCIPFPEILQQGGQILSSLWTLAGLVCPGFASAVAVLGVTSLASVLAGFTNCRGGRKHPPLDSRRWITDIILNRLTGRETNINSCWVLMKCIKT